MGTEERKICAKSLEKVLYHLSGLNKSEANWTTGVEIIKREYKKHIPECSDCKDTYIGFLNLVKKNNQSIEDIDKKYLGLLPKITSSAH